MCVCVVKKPSRARVESFIRTITMADGETKVKELVGAAETVSELEARLCAKHDADRAF